MTDNIKWLTTVPATDCNFKSRLQSATIEEIKEALSIMTGTGTAGNASRIAALSRELRKREKKMEIGFRHGALCGSYEKQANEQGFTLGDKAELFEKIGFSYNMLRIHGLLTDSQAEAICKKLQKQLVKNVRPLEDELK